MKPTVKLAKIARNLLNVSRNRNNSNQILELYLPKHLYKNPATIHFLYILHKKQWDLYHGQIGFQTTHEYIFAMKREILHFLINSQDKTGNNLVFISYSGSISAREMANEAFSKLTSTYRDHMTNNCVDVSALFNDDTYALIHKETGYLILFTKNTLADCVKKILYLWVAMDDIVTPEIEEVIQSDDAEKWMQFYEKEGLLNEPFANFQGFTIEAERSRIENDIGKIRDNYEQRLEAMQRDIQSIKRLERQLLYLTEEEIDVKKINKDSFRPPDIYDIDVYYRNQERDITIVYSILTKLMVDPDYIKPQLIPDDRKRQFFQDIVDQNIIIWIGEDITFKPEPRGGSVLSGSQFRYDDFEPDKVIYRNQHIKSAGCFGTFTSQVLDAYKNRNFFALSLILTQSVAQLNLTDGTILRIFYDEIYNDGRVIVNVPEYDVNMTYNEFVQRRANDEDTIY